MASSRAVAGVGDKNTQSRREISKNVLWAILNNADCHSTRSVVDLCYKVDVRSSGLQMVLIATFQKVMSSANAETCFFGTRHDL